MAQTRDMGQIMKTIMAEFKQYPEAAQLVQKIIKDPSKLPPQVTHQEAEYQNLIDAIPFFKQEFNCLIEVIKEQESQEQKAKQAMPGKPAILVK